MASLRPNQLLSLLRLLLCVLSLVVWDGAATIASPPQQLGIRSALLLLLLEQANCPRHQGFRSGVVRSFAPRDLDDIGIFEQAARANDVP